MRRADGPRRFGLGAAPAVSALVLAVAGPAASSTTAGVACHRAWRVMPSPSVPGELASLAVDAPNDVWAVGTDPSFLIPTQPGRRRPLVEHWDGTRWGVVATVPVRGALEGVAAAGRTDVWAVGSTDRGDALLERWDGRAWSRVRLPWRLALLGVAATTGGDVWAVGYDDAAAMILHWDGRHWMRVFRRPGAELKDVVALSPSDVWAVGDNAERKPLAVHWNGSHWRAYLMNPGAGHDLPVSLYAVSAVSSGDVWAAGSAHIAGLNGYDDDPILRRWNGKRWSSVPRPGNDGGLTALTVGASERVWIAGVNLFPFATENGEGGSYVALRSGTTWQSTSTPKRLVDDLVTDTTGAVWAVGLQGRGSGGNGFPTRTEPVIQRYTCK